MDTKFMQLAPEGWEYSLTEVSGKAFSYVQSDFRPGPAVRYDAVG